MIMLKFLVAEILVTQDGNILPKYIMCNPSEFIIILRNTGADAQRKKNVLIHSLKLENNKSI